MVLLVMGNDTAYATIVQIILLHMHTEVNTIVNNLNVTAF